MSSNALKEAGRVMTICNACRYCEGFCAVFPAMELRRTFTDADLKYLANLCHNCRDCYYACQYAPPHSFDLNFPEAMAELRSQTYEEFACPKKLAPVFRRNGVSVLLTTIASIIIVWLLSLLMSSGQQGIFGRYTQAHSFFNIIPYWAMVFFFSLAGIGALFCLARSIGNFWKTMGPTGQSPFNIKGHLGALRDVLTLKYLTGGGFGCNYPDDEFSHRRRTFHHALFYGFFACFASTTVAAFYDHILGLPAPYGFFSLPVLLGTAGGIGIVVGTAGLLYLKSVMDSRPYAGGGLGMDLSFGLLLMAVSLSGLFLLFFRSTPLMGTLLILHLGFVLAFFLTMPLGKFVHGIYRYIALLRHVQEQAKQ